MFLNLHSWPRAILHIDGDAFFASCEQAIHPEYRGKPVVTGKERGIVAAASYEAKARGVTRGVPLWEVKKLCPDAIILPSDYETYSLFSKRMFAIMRRFTPIVEEYSIDEGFCNITGFRRMYHSSYEEIALKMKQTIEAELGLTVSAGLSLSKVLAKVGSKFRKPAGLTMIPGYKIEDYLKDLAVVKIWGIGERTAAYCNALGIKTALDFARKNEEFIRKNFTKPHCEIWFELNGYSVYEVTTEEKSSYASIGKTKTFTPASCDRAYVYAQLLKNLENACIKARRYNLVASRITIYLKKNSFDYVGLEATLNRASAFPGDIAEIIKELFGKMFAPRTLYRATGIVLHGLASQDSLQLSLFEPPIKIQKLQSIYKVVDELAAKMGKHTLHIGESTMAHTKTTHLYERGDIPQRKMNRIKGETARRHLRVPFLI